MRVIELNTATFKVNEYFFLSKYGVKSHGQLCSLVSPPSLLNELQCIIAEDSGFWRGFSFCSLRPDFTYARLRTVISPFLHFWDLYIS